MLIQTWSQVFLVSLQGLWYGFIQTVPKILLAIIIFIIGWIVAVTIAKLIVAGVDALKLDKLFRGAATDEALARAGWKLHIGGVIGWLVKWLIILGFFMASVNILGLDQVSAFLKEIVLYIPNVIIAVLVLVAGTVLADFVRKIVSGSAMVANVRSARMIGSIAYYAIWIIAIVTALDKLGIFGYFGQILFTGLVLMLAIAFGLAFGLGGKDTAGRWVSRVSEELSSRK
ncbi:MAG TPA: hypothetical protein VG982_02950 [Candidatus Paceibacterota bacterium]|jgi:hypothetical protein|nr:hypothetical protein [Candidatus Paceibacterota bacterium]